jgi:hypothetical protein
MADSGGSDTTVRLAKQRAAITASVCLDSIKSSGLQGGFASAGIHLSSTLPVTAPVKGTGD